MLQQILHASGREIGIVGLYLLTHEGAARAASAASMYSRGFLGEFGAPEETAKTITRSPEILEQLCMPDHGAQIGFDAELRPILSEATHDRLQMVEARALRHGVESFQREWARYRAAMPGKLPPFAGAGYALRPLLMRLLLAPT